MRLQSVAILYPFQAVNASVSIQSCEVVFEEIKFDISSTIIGNYSSWFVQELKSVV